MVARFLHILRNSTAEIITWEGELVTALCIPFGFQDWEAVRRTSEEEQSREERSL